MLKGATRKRRTTGRRIVLGMLGLVCMGALIWLFSGGSRNQRGRTDPRLGGPVAKTDIGVLNGSREIRSPREEDSVAVSAILTEGTNQTSLVPLQPEHGIDLFATLLSRLAATDDPRERQELLDRAAAWLKLLPPDEAATILIDFLVSGGDFDIGLPFRVGAGGNLISHPTLRVAALDWLGQIAPEDARDYARTIFEQSDKADEWALALRNYGRMIEPGKDEYFSTQVARVLQHQHWLTNPTGGLFESLDAFVYDMQNGIIPTALNIGKDNPRLMRPVQLLIDSLCIQHPSEVYDYVMNTPSDFDGMERFRALLLARADVRDPDQKRHVEKYLSASYLSPDEVIAFCHQFPLFSKSTGPRLLTKPLPLTLAEYAHIDRESLRAANDWMDDAKYAAFAEHLTLLVTRLQGIVDSARRGGFVDQNEGGL